MSIVITRIIEQLLSNVRQSDHDMYLARAWDACCDGQLLQLYGITDDLWDGQHEDARRDLESKVLAEIIEKDCL